MCLIFFMDYFFVKGEKPGKLTAGLSNQTV